MAFALFKDARIKREAAKERRDFSIARLREIVARMSKEGVADLKRFGRSKDPEGFDRIWAELERQNAEIADNQQDLKRKFGIEDEDKET
ncbi:MAG TPA: hypothetical protein VII56_13120 [Rhizomicrobium sp.]